MGASLRARLLTLSRERNQTFQLMLTHYVLERLFYRLSQTEHRSSFILKGTMLLTKWFDDPLRPTQDLDFRGFGNDDPDEMVKRSGRSVGGRGFRSTSTHLSGTKHSFAVAISI
ncbi:nucleotidyl transferase AbiEii/AbiGii toxin family protein [Tardiphaga robiniae]|nr:nucleotidyl transferase AbiEii/AbiGii toxin family protein [Tardiphaga robiniae]